MTDPVTPVLDLLHGSVALEAPLLTPEPKDGMPGALHIGWNITGPAGPATYATRKAYGKGGCRLFLPELNRYELAPASFSRGLNMTLETLWFVTLYQRLKPVLGSDTLAENIRVLATPHLVTMDYLRKDGVLRPTAGAMGLSGYDILSSDAEILPIFYRDPLLTPMSRHGALKLRQQHSEELDLLLSIALGETATNPVYTLLEA